ncbi:MAG: hypothetical protein AAB805_01895 [Patescibacteria group bacterium]
MDPNTNQLLRDILEKTEENNKMLHKMHRTLIWGRVFRIFYWTLIIGGSIGAYFYLSPYLQSLFDTYQSLITGVGTLQKTTESIPQTGLDIGAMLKKLGY